jgi:hypothetical protein
MRTLGEVFSMRILLSSACIVALTATLSAHVIRGLEAPTLATAFVSSPSSGTDQIIPVKWGSVDTAVRVACFFVANTSPERLDRRSWPRIVAIGFELPGERSGFALVDPVDDRWELVENAQVELVSREQVILDFAIVARTHGDAPRGIEPGQPGVRGSGTRFCVSGPFPESIVPGQAATIEQVINGVVVDFAGVPGTRGQSDFGVWDNPARVIPLFP